MSVVVAIVMILGGWAAWRKSPLYSFGTTLKIVAVVLVMMAVFIGSAQLNLSVNGELILILALILVFGTGGTALLVRMTDSHVAQLPASVRRVTIYRHRVQRWIWRLFVLLVVCGAGGAMLANDLRWLVWGVGGFTLVCCLPALVALYMAARRRDFGMSVVTANPWVHWEYTQAEWEAWAKQEWDWENKEVSKPLWEKGGTVGFLKVAGGLFAIFLVCSFIQLDGTATEKVLAALGFTVGMLLVFVVISWFSRRNVGRRYRRLLEAPREVFFGDEGVFCDGEYMQWTLSGSYLRAARVAQAPERVDLMFETFNGSATVPVTRRAAIPAGRGSDLALIQQKLSAACPKAIVQMV